MGPSRTSGARCPRRRHSRRAEPRAELLANVAPASSPRVIDSCTIRASWFTLAAGGALVCRDLPAKLTTDARLRRATRPSRGVVGHVNPQFPVKPADGGRLPEVGTSEPWGVSWRCGVSLDVRSSGRSARMSSAGEHDRPARVLGRCRGSRRVPGLEAARNASQIGKPKGAPGVRSMAWPCRTGTVTPRRGCSSMVSRVSLTRCS
jgi:hypothetical protein